MVNQPAVQHFLRHIMMNASVIKDDQCKGGTRGSLKQLINEADKHLSGRGVGIGRRFQLLSTKIQGAQHRTRAMLGRLGRVWLSQRRPRALYRGRGTECRLVVVDQTQIATTSQVAQPRQYVVLGGEFLFGAFFLSEKRVRLNEKPRAFNPLLRVTRQHGRGH